MGDADRRILESCHLPRARREEVAAGLGMRSGEYHLRLVRLLDDPDAEREFPAVVHRMRRLQRQRRAARTLR